MSEQLVTPSSDDSSEFPTGAHTHLSNRNTHIWVDGKQQIMSGKNFEEQYKAFLKTDAEATPVAPIAPEAVAPSTTYWAGNNTFSYDPNRRSVPAEVPVSSETLHKKERVGRFRKAIAAVGLFGAGVLFGAHLSHGHGTIDHNVAANSVPVEETASSPSGEEEASLYTVDEDIIAAVKDTPEEAVSSASDQPIAETVSVATDTVEEAIANVQDQANTNGAVSGVKDTPQEAAAEVSDTSVIENDSNDSVGESVAETESDDIERLRETVTVEPGDGITQVLAKILNQAGYTGTSPEQLFEMYEDLVTDPTIGPEGIFVGDGINIVYHAETDEYWIEITGSTDVSLTPAAAERVDSIRQQK